MKVRLLEIAYARSGDKGNDANIGVIARRPECFDTIRTQVTAARVREVFAGWLEGDVRRYELPGIGALNFVLEGALGGGVTRSLALDAHGKCLASAMLEIELPE